MLDTILCGINAAMGLQKDGLTILGLKKKIIATENFEYYI